MKWYAIIGNDGRYVQVADPAGHEGEVVKLERKGDPHFESLDLSTGRWSPDFEALETHLVRQVSVAAERLKAACMTSGEVKKLEYASKGAEVRAYRSGETSSDKALPYAKALSAAAGITVEQAIARFETGLNASDAVTARIAAKEECAKLAIRQARNSKDCGAMIAAADVHGWDLA